MTDQSAPSWNAQRTFWQSHITNKKQHDYLQWHHLHQPKNLWTNHVDHDQNFREHKNMADKSEAYHHITTSFNQTETQTKPSHLQNKKIESAQWSCKKFYIEGSLCSGVGMKSRTKSDYVWFGRKSSWRIHPNSQPASKIRRICLVWVNDWGKVASNSPS